MIPRVIKSKMMMYIYKGIAFKAPERPEPLVNPYGIMGYREISRTPRKRPGLK